MLKNRHRIIIVDGVPSSDSLCLAMLIDSDNDVFVELTAWHKTLTDLECFQRETLVFHDTVITEKFIESFTDVNAKRFLNKYYRSVVLPMNEEAIADIEKEKENLISRQVITIPANMGSGYKVDIQNG